MVQVSFTLPIPHSKVAEGAAAQLANKMGMDPALVVHAKPMGPDFTFFVVYGRVSHLVDTDKVQVVERDYPLLTPKEVEPRDPQGGCAAGWSSSAAASAPTRTPSASTRSSTSRGSRGRRAWSTTARSRSSTSAPRCRCRSSSSGPGPRRPTPCWSPRWSPSATPTSLNTQEMSAAFREAYPARAAAAADRRRPPLRRVDGRPSSASTGSSPAARRPARSRRTCRTSW